MNVMSLLALIDSKELLSLLSAIGGGLIAVLLGALRGRLKTLEYGVTHDPVAFAADDAVFGSVKVTWQGHKVTNLYTSTITLTNATTRDFEDLKFKVYTGDTLLLTQYTEIPGTSYTLKWTDEYENAVRVEPGQQPTDRQFHTFRHNREYVVPVLNRGKRVVVRFLTTVPPGGQGPAVWVDMLHPGVRVEYRPNVPQIHGVPVKLAISIGLVACAAVVLLTSLYIPFVSLAALVSMIIGLFAQSVGAFIFRAARYMWVLVVG
jgi:hypothetical protein